MPGYAPDPGGEEFAQSRVCFAELEEWLSGPEAGRLTHAEIEEQLDARGRELLRLLHQDHLDLRAAREERRAGVTGADSTWMKSQAIWTVTCRRFASAVMASSWVALPSTRATQVRWWPGSRRPASSNPAAMTAVMSSVTEAVSHAASSAIRLRLCFSPGESRAAGRLVAAIPAPPPLPVEEPGQIPAEPLGLDEAERHLALP